MAGSIVEMPMPSDTMDLVLCNHVLEHISDDNGALNEIYRVLTPNGLLILGVPNEGCALARLRNHVLQPSIAKSTDHVHFYTKSSLIGRLKEAGFNVEYVETEGFFVPHLTITSWMVSKKLGRRILDWARRACPAQAAGLIAVARKP